jgi:RNA polymerase sigma-70 factor (ECF subfamily)
MEPGENKDVDSTGTKKQSADIFERTHWSNVLKVARQSEDATQAFERLAKAYRRPLYEYIRRRGSQPSDAEDLVQSFFEFLITKEVLKYVDPCKGRFRAFLLGVLRNFLVNKYRAQNARKKGGGQVHLPVHDLAPDLQVAPGLAIDCSPDEVFDADWAEALASQALNQLKAEYDIDGQARVFARLNVYLNPVHGQVPHAEAARELGMDEKAVTMAISRLRHRYGKLLLARIRETVRPEHVMDEYRYLARVLLTRERR